MEPEMGVKGDEEALKTAAICFDAALWAVEVSRLVVTSLVWIPVLGLGSLTSIPSP